MNMHTTTFRAVPACLMPYADARRWVVWRWETRNGKRTKPPLSAVGGRVGGFARNDDSTTWATLDEALEAHTLGGCAGIGLQLLDLPGFAAIDLDNVREIGGPLAAWAQTAIERAGSYSEATPSGTGWRILGTVPADFEAMHAKLPHPDGGEFELYANMTTGRYITVTGDGTGELADISGLIRDLRALGELHKAFNRLPGLVQDMIAHGGGHDRSGAFQSAVNSLRNAGWSQADAQRIFEAHPTGPAAKYIEGNRLTEELARSWDKAGDRRAPTSDGRPRPNCETDPDLSHDALATELGARSWDANARHVALWGKWLFWSGTRWEIDDRLDHLTRTRAFLRHRAADLIEWAEGKAAGIEATEGEDKAEKLRRWAKEQARGLRNKTTVAAVESLARANKGSVARADDFDRDRLLLGTPGGTVDLRTGQLRPPGRGDMITKLTACAPAPGTPQRWLSFLHEVFDGDAELVAFMQRAAGYALTGETREHKLLFLYGTGRNGKSVYLDVLTHIWSDYARRVPAAAFLHSQGERHPTDIAGLQGARLAVGSELPKGKTWDESVIKDLTGGDKMTARFMRQDFFEFDPQLTLMIAGNNMPSFRGVDEAIRARVVLVPFTVTIPPEKRDRHLADKLKAEAGQILQWAIEGALIWQRNGLDVPAKVEKASADYFDAEDIVGLFIGDEIETIGGAFTASRDLHQRFTQWCEGQGLAAWTQNTLVKELRGRGFTDHRSNGKRGLTGLRLR